MGGEYSIIVDGDALRNIARVAATLSRHEFGIFGIEDVDGAMAALGK